MGRGLLLRGVKEMKRSVWKWMFGISLTLLILLTLFTACIWALGNATGAMLGGIMGSLDPDNFGYHYLLLNKFLADSVGSPIFYICMVDFTMLLGSIAGLIVTRKTKK